MREALKLALEALEDPAILNGVNNAKFLIKQALAQKEQEPVAFYVYKPTLPRGHLGNVSDGALPWVYDQDPSSGYSARMLVYTTPPKREWVGLTDEERAKCWRSSAKQSAINIEAKLKELNK